MKPEHFSGFDEKEKSGLLRNRFVSQQSLFVRMWKTVGSDLAEKLPVGDDFGDERLLRWGLLKDGGSPAGKISQSEHCNVPGNRV